MPGYQNNTYFLYPIRPSIYRILKASDEGLAIVQWLLYSSTSQSTLFSHVGRFTVFIGWTRTRSRPTPWSKTVCKIYQGTKNCKELIFIRVYQIVCCALLCWNNQLWKKKVQQRKTIWFQVRPHAQIQRGGAVGPQPPPPTHTGKSLILYISKRN